ncbi:MAG: hypothetical protein GF328_09415, partial [Candidatus Latescibacteria bacterium]|nr:hypothetical protein [Candidatus Latescibacterota bacterium]
MRVLVNGCFGYRNLGDEAILASLGHRAARFSGLDLRVISGDPEETTRSHGMAAVRRPIVHPFRPWRPSRFADRIRLRRMVRACDAVILGGGGVLVDVFPNVVANYLAPLDAAQRMGRPTAAFGIGGEHLVHRSSRERVRAVLGRADFVAVRDRRTQRLLLECGLHEERVFLGADPALELWDLLGRGDRAPAAETPRVVLFPCAYLGRDEREEEARRSFWVDLAGRLAAIGAVVRILPLSPRDRRWVEPMRARQADAGGTLDAEVPPIEACLEGIGTSDLVVAEKLHGAVLALSAGVPPVMLAYREKVEALAEESDLHDWCFRAGHGELLPFALPDPAAVETVARTILEDPDGARQRVRASVDRLRDR